MDSTPLSIEVVLVNDGSRDRTAELMEALSLVDARYQSIFLARNHGHQIAVTAGLQFAQGTEVVMVIDGDLQDPPELLFQLYEQYQKGFDVVYAIRQKRKENYWKRIAYKSFYRLLKKISYIDIPLDSGDFALMSRRVVNVLNAMPEESRYLRGMRSWVGFRQIGVTYEREARHSGESKYSFKLLLRLAYNGVFNFSEFPIKIIKRISYFSIGISLIYFLITLYKRFILQEVPEGFTALLFAIIFFSGIQLFFLGILGEYILRIFFQVKGRPLFVLEKRIVNHQKI
jgi:dolichol-phosphate mannosyltransferase